MFTSRNDKYLTPFNPTVYSRNDKYLTDEDYIAQLETRFQENTDFRSEDGTRLTSYKGDLEEDTNSLWDSRKYSLKEEEKYTDMYQSYKP